MIQRRAIVGRRLVGWAADKLGEAFDAVDIGDLGFGYEATDDHVVDQALAEGGSVGIGHEKLLFWVGTRRVSYLETGRVLPCEGAIRGRRAINALRPLFLVFLLPISLLLLTSVARAEDDSMTSAEIRKLIEKMDDAGHPPNCDGPWSGSMCSTGQAERKRCLALRENILADSGDFVVHPVIQTDEYDQREFDKYAGKCRGTAFNKTYAPNSPRASGVLSESDKGLRLYVVKDFDPGKDDLLVFGRHYGHIEPYEKKEFEKAKAEGRQFFPPHFWRSLFSRVDYKSCRVHEFQEVYEPGSGTVGVPNPSDGWDFDKVSVIHIRNVYYITEYHRFLFDKIGTPTFSIIKIDNDPAHFWGGAEQCDFQ